MANVQVVIGGPAVLVTRNGSLGTSGSPGIQLCSAGGSPLDVFTGSNPIAIGTTYTSPNGATIVIDASSNAVIQVPAGYSVGPQTNCHYAVSTSSQGPWSGTLDIVAPPTPAPANLTVSVVY